MSESLHSAEKDAPDCWCGGEVGPRNPGDENGLGCLESIWHVWQEPPAPRTHKGLHNLLICCGPIPPGGTPGCCRVSPPVDKP